jgi:hypothetical protein
MLQLFMSDRVHRAAEESGTGGMDQGGVPKSFLQNSHRPVFNGSHRTQTILQFAHSLEGSVPD